MGELDGQSGFGYLRDCVCLLSLRPGLRGMEIPVTGAFSAKRRPHGASGQPTEILAKLCALLCGDSPWLVGKRGVVSRLDGCESWGPGGMALGGGWKTGARQRSLALFYQLHRCHGHACWLISDADSMRNCMR